MATIRNLCTRCIVLEKGNIRYNGDVDTAIAEYMNSSFSMFSGESRDVKLRFDNKLINTVIDRFGKDVSLIPDGNEHFTVHVKVKAEAPFFAWLFQFGSKAKIIEPEELKTKYMVHLNEVLETMKRELLNFPNGVWEII